MTWVHLWYPDEFEDLLETKAHLELLVAACEGGRPDEIAGSARSARRHLDRMGASRDRAA